MNNKLLKDFCKTVRDSTLKRLKTVPEGYENWRISKNALSFAKLVKILGPEKEHVNFGRSGTNLFHLSNPYLII